MIAALPVVAVLAAPAADHRAEDAAIDRGLLFPRAETAGAGQGTLDFYELLFLGVGYAPTDDLQFGVTALVPGVFEDVLLGVLGGKWVFARWANGTALGAYAEVVARDGGTLTGYLVGGGVLWDQRFATDLISFHAGVIADAVVHAEGTERTALYRLTAGPVVRVNHHLKLTTELWWFAATGGGRGPETADRRVVPGLRIYGPEFAADIGWLFDVFDDGSGQGGGDSAIAEGTDDPTDLPWVALRGRF